MITLFLYTIKPNGKWKKAVQYAQDKFSVDLNALLEKKEISAALYHTAGKGTRMAPLPASENNNKPGVVRFELGYALRCVDGYTILSDERLSPVFSLVSFSHPIALGYPII